MDTNKKLLWIFLLTHLMSCSTEAQESRSGMVQLRITFYKKDKSAGLVVYNNLYYKDSLSIQEIRQTITNTDTANITTVRYPLLFCRYIDPENMTMYDYKTFSDTAVPYRKSFLPDSTLEDGGWSYYSWKFPIVKGIAVAMDDTVLDNVTYQREKLYFQNDDTSKSFKIGYFRCDNKGLLFSLEKKYSQSKNCTMVKYLDYRISHGKPVLFAKTEVLFLSDKLSDEDLRVFTAWERNAKENPVVMH